MLHDPSIRTNMVLAIVSGCGIVASMADVKKTLQDAAYVAVGFGVLGFQRAQVRRQELAKRLAAGNRPDLAEYRTKLTELRGRVEPVVKELEQRIDPVLDDLEGRLPEQAKSIVQQARVRAKALLPAGTAA